MFREEKLSEITSQIEELKELSFLNYFSDEIIDFLDQFSKRILSNKISRDYPELTVLGFWLRKSNISKIKREFFTKNKDKILVSRGLVFQIPPSNVNSIFVYSWALSLLAGNKNVVRITTKKSPQLKTICDVLENILRSEKWEGIYERNKFFSYEYNDEINKYLSLKCDLRVVWGGDMTIEKLRTFKLKTHSNEMNFPDKYSISIINLEKFSNLDDLNKLKLIEKFMNDSYWFDQMACSSPKILFWLTNEEKKFKIKDQFWRKLDYLIKKNNKKLSSIDSINKKVASDRVAIELEHYKIFDYSERLVTRVSLNEIVIKNDLMPGAGFFYETNIQSLNDILPILERKLQTISYYGISYQKWKEFIKSNNPKGIDRIVPIGKALDFEVVWDGIDMLYSFSREITIK